MGFRNRGFEDFLFEWPLGVIRDSDIAVIFPNEAGRRHAIVNRAMKRGELIRLRRGAYLLGKPFRKNLPSQLEIAHVLYGPSYISFESALSYHNLIPEVVYSTTCATAKRSQKFNTPLGWFRFIHVPERLCYLGTIRIESDATSYLIAEPWKAIADHFYAHKRNWRNLDELCSDLRIEHEDIRATSLDSLEVLSAHYQSPRVRLFLAKLLKEMR